MNAARRRRQEHHRAGDLVGLADPAQRRRWRSPLRAASGSSHKRAGEIGLDQARRDAVHADVVRAEFVRQVARELHVGGLGDAIGADHRRAAQAADRRDDDDRPVPALAHLGRDHLDQPVVGDDVVVEDLAELLVGDARLRAVIGVRRGVADEDVDLAERARGSRRPDAAAPPCRRCWRRPRSRCRRRTCALISAATASHASCLRLEITTFAPCSASSRADALPMPRDEPVMIATLPVRSNSDIAAPPLAEVGSPLPPSASSPSPLRSGGISPAFSAKSHAASASRARSPPSSPPARSTRCRR